MVHFQGGRQGIDITAYPDLDEFFEDLAQAYRQELASLYDSRMPLHQVRRHESRISLDRGSREEAQSREAIRTCCRTRMQR